MKEQVYNIFNTFRYIKIIIWFNYMIFMCFYLTLFKDGNIKFYSLLAVKWWPWFAEFFRNSYITFLFYWQ